MPLALRYPVRDEDGVLDGPPERWRDLVVLFAGTAWDGNMFPDQHVAGRLTRWAPVLYVDPPLSVIRNPERLVGRVPSPVSRLRLVDDRLLRLTPVVTPGPWRRPVRSVTHAVVRGAARSVVARLGVRRAQAVVAAHLDPVLHAVPARRTLLYGTDDFAAGASLMGVADEFLRRREPRQLADADVAVTVSEALAAKWRGLGHPHVVVVPNGCDADAFAAGTASPRPADVDLPAPVAGFVGHMSDRIDFDLLEATAATGVSLLLVGPVQPTFGGGRLEQLLSRPNVRWVGNKAFEDLPAYVAAMDVGLVPYADTAFNRASFPLKTLEYLAGGLPVVATGLPEIVGLRTEHVVVADGADEYAQAVLRTSTLARTSDDVAARQQVARTHSWDNRARDVAGLLGLLHDDAGAGTRPGG